MPLPTRRTVVLIAGNESNASEYGCLLSFNGNSVYCTYSLPSLFVPRRRSRSQWFFVLLLKFSSCRRHVFRYETSTVLIIASSPTPQVPSRSTRKNVGGNAFALVSVEQGPCGPAFGMPDHADLVEGEVLQEALDVPGHWSRTTIGGVVML